jgi:hypothetical protein
MKLPTSAQTAVRSYPMKLPLPTSAQTVARSYPMKLPTSARTAAQSRARQRPTRNQHNRPMKNHPVVAPKDLPAGLRDPLVGLRDLPVDLRVLPVGLKDPPVDQAGRLGGPADHLVGPEGHPAKREVELAYNPHTYNTGY